MQELQGLQLLLEKEIAILEELIGLSHRKTEAITKDDLSLLEEIVLKEEALSKSLKTVDDACSPQAQFFFRNRSNSSRIPEKCSDLMAKVREKAIELRLNNELNQELIRDSLNLVQFSINTLLSDGAPAVYGASGKMASGKRRNQVLDYKG